VQIVDRRVDRSAGICSSTAVMRRSHLEPKESTGPERSQKLPPSPPRPFPLP
jgi:hypothetical protein